MASMSYEREILLRKADELDKQSKHQQATEIYLSLLKEEPDNISLLVKAAHSIFWGDNWGHFDGKIEENIKKMFELLERAVSLEPRNPDVGYNLALYLALYGDGDTEYAIAAAREIKRILEIDPAHLKTLYHMAREYHLVQAGITVNEALVLYERATLANPNSYEVWESYGEFLQNRFGHTKNIEEIAKEGTSIRKMLVAYQNVKSKMSEEDFVRRKGYIDGQIKKCRDMLARLNRARKRLENQIDKASKNPNTDERPLLDFLQFSILDSQIYGHAEPSYLIYFEAKRDIRANPDLIIKAIMKLADLGFSTTYNISNEQIEMTLQELKKDLRGHTDKYLRTHYFNSKFYFKVTDKGKIELDKKIYDTYGKLFRISSQLDDFESDLKSSTY